MKVTVTSENFYEAVEAGNIYDFSNYPEVIVGNVEDSDDNIVYDLVTSTGHGIFGGSVSEYTLGKLAPGKVKLVSQFGVAVAAGFIEGEGYQYYAEGSNEEFTEDLKVTIVTSVLGDLAVKGIMFAVGAATAPAWLTIGGSALIAAGLGLAWNAINDDDQGDVNLDGDTNQLINQSQGSGSQDSASTDTQNATTWQEHNEGDGNILDDQQVEPEVVAEYDQMDAHTGHYEVVEKFDDGSMQIHDYSWDGQYKGSRYVGPEGEFKYNDPRKGYEERFDETRDNDSETGHVRHDAQNDGENNNEDENTYESVTEGDEEREQNEDPNENDDGGSSGSDDDDEGNDADGADGVEGRPNPEDRPNPFESNAQGGNNRPNPFESKSNPWDDDYRPNPEDDWGVNGPNAKSLKGMKTEQMHDTLMDFHADAIMGNLQAMGFKDAIISGARQNENGDFQVIFDLDGNLKSSSAKEHGIDVVQVVTGFMDNKKVEVTEFLIETMAADTLGM